MELDHGNELDAPHFMHCSFYLLGELSYEIGSVVGSGHYAAVHVGRRKSSNEVVAIKTVDKSRIRGREKMLKREIQIMQLCDHDNIVKMYDYFDSPTRVFIVMEYIKVGPVGLRALRARIRIYMLYVMTIHYYDLIECNGSLLDHRRR